MDQEVQWARLGAVPLRLSFFAGYRVIDVLVRNPSMNIVTSIVFQSLHNLAWAVLLTKSKARYFAADGDLSLLEAMKQFRPSDFLTAFEIGFLSKKDSCDNIIEDVGTKVAQIDPSQVGKMVELAEVLAENTGISLEDFLYKENEAFESFKGECI